MVAGRVVRFDSARGYGFIAPGHGGEDVFLHVNDLLIPESQVRPGLAVEFEIEDGDRGLKASSVRLAAGAAHKPSSLPAPDSRVPTARAAGQADDDCLCDVLSADEFHREITEVLLEAAGTLTGEQILQVRRALLRFAGDHGWIES
ncbi:cold-shock protein [Kitasatospora sp. HPMI-4]|uniref:cold-shock protein n=1 Tax=Kitasatospora sp. HPMI-4 TaxID=3448443 RepID=UPI003F1C8879